jgi:Protein of unknown function (DUF2892)
VTQNVGAVDRVVRIIVGLLLIAYAIPVWFAPSNWNWIGWIGVIPLLTGVFGNCPVYTFIGLSTCPARSKQ